MIAAGLVRALEQHGQARPPRQEYAGKKRVCGPSLRDEDAGKAFLFGSAWSDDEHPGKKRKQRSCGRALRDEQQPAGETFPPSDEDAGKQRSCGLALRDEHAGKATPCGCA